MSSTSDVIVPAPPSRRFATSPPSRAIPDSSPGLATRPALAQARSSAAVILQTLLTPPTPWIARRFFSGFRSVLRCRGVIGVDGCPLAPWERTGLCVVVAQQFGPDSARPRMVQDLTAVTTSKTVMWHRYRRFRKSCSWRQYQLLDSEF